MRASGSVDSPSKRDAPAPSAATQLRPRLLHRVEEDAVDAELADERRRLPRVVARAPRRRAGVPRVVVEEDPHAARLEVARRARARSGHVAVLVELVALVDPDHRVRVPEHDAVEPAELALVLVEQPLGREALGRRGRRAARPRATTSATAKQRCVHASSGRS